MTQYLYSGITEQAKAALRRKADAEVLRRQRHWRGAMYLLGYAVECRLKAKLMEIYRASTLEQLETSLSTRLGQEVDLRTHSIEYLFSFTNARARLIAPNGDKQHLRAYQTCNAWTVSWRYNPLEGREDQCQRFFDAVDEFLSFLSSSV